MIDVKAKIHDKFSVEFKVKFNGKDNAPQSDFAINTWIFVPYSLDINDATYDKKQFLGDVKSNVRLSTPDFTLKQIADYQTAPYSNVRDAIANLPPHKPRAEEHNAGNEYVEYEFQIKLFAAIFKSAIRDATSQLLLQNDAFAAECLQYCDNVRTLLQHYRALRPSIPHYAIAPFVFADEYMSHLVELQVLRLVKATDALEMNDVRAGLVALVIEERNYKNSQSYTDVHPLTEDEATESTSTENPQLPNSFNSQLLTRHSMLKKYVSSALFLKVNTQKDGQAVEQFWFGVAAGVAMVVSTLVALPFQRYWANYPTLIFIILVVAYMLKDRIKEMMRGMFANQLKNRYFDNRTTVKIKDQQVGWIKESMDFMANEKIPQSVLQYRERNKLETENAQWEERTIFYRKRVFVDNDLLKNQYRYDFDGIIDIMRFHLHHFTQKMDDPDTEITTVNAKGMLQTIHAAKTYTLHIIMQCQSEGQLEYHPFHITLTRDGIVKIV